MEIEISALEQSQASGLGTTQRLFGRKWHLGPRNETERKLSFPGSLLSGILAKSPPGLPKALLSITGREHMATHLLSRRYGISALKILVVCALLLTACKAHQMGREPTRPATPLATPSPFASPIEINGTGLIGQVISASTGTPITGTPVRLARVIWNDDHSEGVYVLEGARSPSCITDNNGFFFFVNIEAADYVIVVGDVYGAHTIISNPDGTARIFTVAQDKVTNAGQIKAKLP